MDDSAVPFVSLWRDQGQDGDYLIELLIIYPSQVILALTELYYYLAPYAEMSLVIRPLMHTLNHTREVS